MSISYGTLWSSIIFDIYIFSLKSVITVTLPSDNFTICNFINNFLSDDITVKFFTQPNLNVKSIRMCSQQLSYKRNLCDRTHGQTGNIHTYDIIFSS